MQNNKGFSTISQACVNNNCGLCYSVFVNGASFWVKKIHMGSAGGKWNLHQILVETRIRLWKDICSQLSSNPHSKMKTLIYTPEKPFIGNSNSNPKLKRLHLHAWKIIRGVQFSTKFWIQTFTDEQERELKKKKPLGDQHRNGGNHCKPLQNPRLFLQPLRQQLRSS